MTDFDTSFVPDYTKLFRLDDRVFVVFGANNGMGRQSAHALSQLGAKVVCVGRDADRTERVAAEVGGIAILADVTKKTDVERLFAEVWDTYGKVNGIVDIVAVPQTVKFADLSEDDWDWQRHNVLSHAMYALQIGAPMVAKSGGGSLTFVGSLGGSVVNLGMTNAFHYGVLKAGLHHMAVMAGVMLGSSNIRVNCVVPGLTLTPRVVEQLGQAKVDAMAQMYPLKRIAGPSDIAAAIAFMASDLAHNVNSQVFVVDGGHSVQSAPPLSPSQEPVFANSRDKS